MVRLDRGQESQNIQVKLITVNHGNTIKVFLNFFWTKGHKIFEILAMRPRLLMNFTLRCVRSYLVVNSRGGISNPHPWLTPAEQRFAPLAREQYMQ